jgi:hypothetical protein
MRVAAATCGYGGSVGMKRNDKGKSVARYLTGHAGIPMLRFDYETSIIEAPKPYSIRVATDAAWWRFGQYVKDTSEKSGIPFVVRFDGYINGVDQAVVGCTLSTFTQLLETYENNLRRGEQ